MRGDKGTRRQGARGTEAVAALRAVGLNRNGVECVRRVSGVFGAGGEVVGCPDGRGCAGLALIGEGSLLRG